MRLTERDREILRYIHQHRFLRSDHLTSPCKDGGNVLDFISKKEDVSIHDAALRACEWFTIPLAEISSETAGKPSDKPSETRKQSKSNPASPPVDENTPNPPLRFRLEKLDRSHPYLTDRGISQETVIDFGLGYFTGEKGLMVGRIVIPIHNVNGELIAYCGRWPGDPPKDTPKYKLPAGFKKSLELFNVDRAVKEPTDNPLVIVEGFFDAINLHQHGCRKVVALMGSTMSSRGLAVSPLCSNGGATCPPLVGRRRLEGRLSSGCCRAAASQCSTSGICGFGSLVLFDASRES